MTCSSCVNAIKSAVSGLPGISSADISLAENCGTFVHNLVLVSAKRIAETIEDCGFDVEILPSAQQTHATPADDFGTSEKFLL